MDNKELSGKILSLLQNGTWTPKGVTEYLKNEGRDVNYPEVYRRFSELIKKGLIDVDRCDGKQTYFKLSDTEPSEEPELKVKVDPKAYTSTPKWTPKDTAEYLGGVTGTEPTTKIVKQTTREPKKEKTMKPKKEPRLVATIDIYEIDGTHFIRFMDFVKLFNKD